MSVVQPIYKVGDLVHYNPPPVWEKPVTDPTFGIVVSVSDSAGPSGYGYWVMWTCGRKTREWDCYLREGVTPSQGRTPQCEGETDGNL